MRYRSWLIYVSQCTKDRLHGLRTGVGRVRWLFHFKVQLRVNAVVRDRHVGASMKQDQVSFKGTDLGLREPGSSTDRCTKEPQVFSRATKLSEPSMLSLLWRVRLRACRRMASSPIGEISKRTDVDLARRSHVLCLQAHEWSDRGPSNPHQQIRWRPGNGAGQRRGLFGCAQAARMHHCWRAR